MIIKKGTKFDGII